jgi:hypothetical protein
MPEGTWGDHTNIISINTTKVASATPTMLRHCDGTFTITVGGYPRGGIPSCMKRVYLCTSFAKPMMQAERRAPINGGGHVALAGHKRPAGPGSAFPEPAYQPGGGRCDPCRGAVARTARAALWSNNYLWVNFGQVLRSGSSTGSMETSEIIDWIAAFRLWPLWAVHADNSCRWPFHCHNL